MVDTMARPLDGWIHNPPYGAARHVGAAGYYTADQTPLCLPPPSSLISGTSAVHEAPAPIPARATLATATLSAPAARLPPSLHTNVRPAYGYHDYQTPSPSQQSSPPLPAPTSQPLYHVAALAHQRRNAVLDLAHVSPTLSSSTASERSFEDFQDDRVSQIHAPGFSRMQQHHHQQQPSPLPPTLPHHRQQAYTNRPVRQHRRLSGQDQHHYPDMSSRSRLPAAAYAQNALARQAPQPSSPQTRQTWSPRSEPNTSQVRISDLLSNEEPQARPLGSSVVPRTPMPNGPASAPATRSPYRISIRQQPVAARSCGFGERDRRVIDPPPIVQLTINDKNMSREEVSQRIQYPYLVMSCNIYDKTGQHDASAMPEDYQKQRRLMGALMVSSFVGVDENGEEGCFFCFPDLSCRTPGSFRLKFALVILDPVACTQQGKKFPIVSDSMSDVFTVYNAKDFPGMQASTRLTKRLKEQGCLISIKKGNDKTSHGRDDSDDDEGSSSGRQKRAKRS